MRRSRIRWEMVGSRARETLVRSTYEMVYMIKATGMMRSHRCWVMRGRVAKLAGKGDQEIYDSSQKGCETAT